MMEKIDTSGWKEFTVGELFEVSRPVARSQAKYKEGNVPFVASGNYNNGVVKWCEPLEDEVLDAKGCISVSPLDGSAFYQPVDFLGRGGAGSAILLLRNEKLTEMSGLFISAVLRAALTKFSYNDQINSQTILVQGLKLPATVEGEPDFAYMDMYMQNVMKESEASLENLRRADKTKTTVDTVGWDEFWLRVLFDFKLPQGDLQVKQVEDGDIPLITPSAFNNGLLQRVSSESKSTLFSANTLTVDMFGNAYYQEEDYFVTAHGHVNVLIPKMTLNKNNGMFIATAIRSMFLKKYGFSEMCTQKVLKAEKVMLPVVSEGIPDWDYMDRYMSEILDTASASLDVLAGVAS